MLRISFPLNRRLLTFSLEKYDYEVNIVNDLVENVTALNKQNMIVHNFIIYN